MSKDPAYVELIRTGGAAYPSGTTGAPFFRGMSLRDWFAGMAMQGLIAAKTAVHGEGTVAEILSKAAYQIADEMLVAQTATAPHQAEKDGNHDCMS